MQYVHCFKIKILHVLPRRAPLWNAPSETSFRIADCGEQPIQCPEQPISTSASEQTHYYIRLIIYISYINKVCSVRSASNGTKVTVSTSAFHTRYIILSKQVWNLLHCV